MQGHGSSVGTLPENMSFDHGSTTDTGLDSQMPWNSSQNWLPSYSATNVQSPHHPGHAGLTSEWCLGETSSGTPQGQHHHSENKKEHAWSVHSQDALTLEESEYEPSNIPSTDNFDVDVNDTQTANGSSILQISGPDSLPPDPNLHSEFGGCETYCQVVQRSNTYLSIGSPNEHIPSTGGSSNSLRAPSEFGEDRPGCSLDGQRTSCKRKALEIHPGQSSGAGSSNSFQHAERSQRHAVPAAQITPSHIGVSVQIENEQVNDTELEQVNSRPRLGDGRAVAASPFPLTARVTAPPRSFRLHINGIPQQDHIPRNSSLTEADIGNVNASSSQPAASGLVTRSRLPDMNPVPCVENGNSHGQPVFLNIPSVHRNPQSRWGGASISRPSSLSALTNSQQRDDVLSQQSPSTNVPRSISEHPVFVPASESGSSSQQPNWIFSGGGNSVAGNPACTSRAGPTSRVDSSAPSSSDWGRPQYTRRISEIVRRSLLSSAGAETGGQNVHHATQSSSSVAASQGIAISSGSGTPAPHLLSSRSALLARHLESDLRMPYVLRNLASASEGRSSVMSEHIRHVLDLMRRGEGLRFEDVMMLDHPAFADIHDRHRDMRLDVDNMSYEELLALEERIGNVCTGLNEETITSRLKRKKYTDIEADNDRADAEPCSICREEYNDGEDLGTLECGHDFHTDCIKQWLKHKNLCPVCKTTGLTT